MSQLHLSDEILMAFADGELDTAMTTAVAKAMAEDPGIAKKINEFQQSRRLTRSYFASALESDVPAELREAVAAQIRAYETSDEGRTEPRPTPSRNVTAARKPQFLKMALAACIAVAAAGLGYFVGQHQAEGSAGLIAQLESPLIREALSRNPSGGEAEMPMGRMRVISTYRLADGSLCREFKLRGASGVADAVACRSDEWRVTFALANAAPDAEYVPSGGGDMMASYLQSVGAGEPLVDGAEAKALAEGVH